MKIKILKILGYDLREFINIKKILIGFLIIFLIPFFNLLGIFIFKMIGFNIATSQLAILEGFEDFIYQFNLICLGGIIVPLFAGIYGAKSVIGYGVRVKVIYSKPINRGELIISKLISF
ncbi:MAG: hypothetical protein ACTSRP_11745 [Candidatus Helarchaeota archaeon]